MALYSQIVLLCTLTQSQLSQLRNTSIQKTPVRTHPYVRGGRTAQTCGWSSVKYRITFPIVGKLHITTTAIINPALLSANAAGTYNLITAPRAYWCNWVEWY